MAKRDHCKVGTRDYCVECGKVIELTARENRFRDPVWHHIEPEDPDHKTNCSFDEEANAWNRWKRSNPKNFCWVVMDTSWTMSHCTRPVTDEERHMCGIHANAERKAEERDREQTQKWELNDYIRDEVGKIAQRLEEEYGITSQAHYDSHHHQYTGKIVVHDPMSLMEKLEATDEEF